MVLNYDKAVIKYFMYLGEDDISSKATNKCCRCVCVLLGNPCC